MKLMELEDAVQHSTFFIVRTIKALKEQSVIIKFANRSTQNYYIARNSN